ncbi:MAG: hypothetical protein FWF15_07275 [Oscillospiraceae bacterium]|nr:hypothetical protein [Oscillospiraceae bacterium]
MKLDDVLKANYPSDEKIKELRIKIDGRTKKYKTLADIMEMIYSKQNKKHSIGFCTFV